MTISLKRQLRDYGLKRRGAQIEYQELREIMLWENLGLGSFEGTEQCGTR